MSNTQDFDSIEDLKALLVEQFQFPETVQLDGGGNVALKYLRLQRIMADCGESGIYGERRHYVFSVRANISLSWVEPRDVACCLAKKGGCCGQKKAGIITYANEADVRRWKNGGGR